ncbi:hypothetical protein D6C79_05581 [Aureobasidium pullulans]|nr:hypothetical protein D6C79_05581 [Aureobasidium pullulans]
MDKLPLELKQRICSFLHASPRLLKPIRLVSKDFASAAAPYLIPRLSLFRHPDSCAEVKEITKHPIFSKHVTTLVVDLSVLKSQSNFQSWIDDHDHLQHAYPDWWDFKPEDVEYDEDGDPLLSNSQSRAKWMHSCREFDKEAKRVTKRLMKSQEKYWKAQQGLAAKLSGGEFRRRFFKTIHLAFRMCPNLSNIVIAPPQPCEPTLGKRYHIFEAIHPSKGSWIEPKSHDPSDFEMTDLMQAVHNTEIDLSSLTIIDFPFRCADYSKVGNLEFLGRLKHIRIGWNRLGNNPKTKFGADLEKVLRKTHSLETIWINMPPLIHRKEEYTANGLLDAMSLECLRDVMLSNLSVSEDSLVNFLLRHSETLEMLSLGITLTDGSYESAFRRISMQMKALVRVQFISLIQWVSDVPKMASPSWCTDAIDCVLRGEALSEPEYYYLSEAFDELELGEGCEGPRRYEDLPEDGLWEDFDGNVNFCF